MDGWREGGVGGGRKAEREGGMMRNCLRQLLTSAIGVGFGVPATIS